MNTLKEGKNRGYVIAGIGGIVAFIAFFLPYVSASGTLYPTGISWSGSTIGGGLYFELLASIVAIGIPLILIYSHKAFGLTNMPLDKQIRYGIFTMIGAGAVGLLAELILALNHSSINGLDLTTSDVGLGIGWWLYLFGAIAMVVGSVMALRNPQTFAAQAWQQYSSTQYPYSQPSAQQPNPYPPSPYPTTGQQPYPPYAPQYPTDPEQYQATEMGQQCSPTERRPMPQTGPQQYPNTGPQAQPYAPSGELLPPPPPPHSSQQLPPI